MIGRSADSRLPRTFLYWTAILAITPMGARAMEPSALSLEKTGDNLTIDMNGKLVLQGGLVRLRNSTTEEMQFEYTAGPEQAILPIVRNVNGEVVSSGRRYGVFRSPTLESQRITIAPGESHNFSIMHLLETVPREKQIPGDYRVRVRVEYRGRIWESDEISVTVE